MCTDEGPLQPRKRMQGGRASNKNDDVIYMSKTILLSAKKRRYNGPLYDVIVYLFLGWIRRRRLLVQLPTRRVCVRLETDQPLALLGFLS